MSIERKPRPDGRPGKPVLAECPCGAPVRGGRFLEMHLLNDHSPEDFGLSPLGERRTREVAR